MGTIQPTFPCTYTLPVIGLPEGICIKALLDNVKKTTSESQKQVVGCKKKGIISEWQYPNLARLFLPLLLGGKIIGITLLPLLLGAKVIGTIPPTISYPVKYGYEISERKIMLTVTKDMVGKPEQKTLERYYAGEVKYIENVFKEAITAVESTQ